VGLHPLWYKRQHTTNVTLSPNNRSMQRERKEEITQYHNHIFEHDLWTPDAKIVADSLVVLADIRS
jgi:hypothetical protein